MFPEVLQECGGFGTQLEFVTAGVCVCSVGLFVSIQRAWVPHYAFHVSCS